MILLVFSLVFYAWGEPKYIFLMIATAFVDYVFGLLIERFRGRWQSKLFLTLAAVITLSSLALFKYSSFFSENVNSLFSLNLPNLKLALPIGISFYTFQALTYVIDVYRGSVKVQPSFYKLLLYVSMFPQLIAGPIVRYSDVEEQIEERTVTLKNISAGVMRFEEGNYSKFCGSAHGKAHRRRFDRAFKRGSVDRYNLIHPANLLRFFGLFRYGNRPRAYVRLFVPREFQLPVLRRVCF